MDCNASYASVADWLEERFRDELKLVEGRQQALLTELRLHLRQVQPAVHAVRVIPPELSGRPSPSLDVKTGRSVLRPPEAVKSESEQVKDGSLEFGNGKLWNFPMKHPWSMGTSHAFNHYHLCTIVRVIIIGLINEVPNRNEAIEDFPLPGKNIREFIACSAFWGFRISTQSMIVGDDIPYLLAMFESR